MRLLTIKALYRAFPELDHFSDEQCRTFVAAAKGDLLLRCFRLFIQIILALGAFYLVTTVVVLGISAADGSNSLQSDRGFFIIGIAIMIFAFGSAALAFLLTRDFLLRRRIRGVMQSRGSCHDCGYGLTGLPVITTSAASSTTHAVTCPECGTPHAADAILGETIPDAKGTLRYVPSPNAPGRIRPGSAQRLIYRNAKIVVSTCVAFVFLISALAGGYEAFIRHQATLAKEQVLSPDELKEVLARAFPSLPDDDSADDPHPFVRLRAIEERIQEVRRRTSIEIRGTEEGINEDLAALLAREIDVEEGYGTRLAEERELAERFISTLTREGVFDAADEVARMHRRLPLIDNRRPIDLNSMALYGHGAMFIEILRPNRARLRKAILDDSSTVAAQALTTHLLLVGHGATIPGGSSQTWARREHAAAIQLATYALSRHRTVEWVTAITSSLSTPTSFPLRSQFLPVEQAYAQSISSSIFANPANVRFGKHSEFYRPWINDHPGVIVGTLSSASRELQSRYNARIATEDKDRFERPPAPVVGVRHATNLYTLSDSPYWLDFSDTHTALTRAVPLFLAIEQFLLDNKRLPTTLGELIPRYIATIPIDPFSGKPLLYKPNPPGADPQIPNAYAIYSSGPDQLDHGATFPADILNDHNLRPQFPDTPLITMPPTTPPRR